MQCRLGAQLTPWALRPNIKDKPFRGNNLHNATYGLSNLRALRYSPWLASEKAATGRKQYLLTKDDTFSTVFKRAADLFGRCVSIANTPCQDDNSEDEDTALAWSDILTHTLIATRATRSVQRSLCAPLKPGRSKLRKYRKVYAGHDETWSVVPLGNKGYHLWCAGRDADNEEVWVSVHRLFCYFMHGPPPEGENNAMHIGACQSPGSRNCIGMSCLKWGSASVNTQSGVAYRGRDRWETAVDAPLTRPSSAKRVRA